MLAGGVVFLVLAYATAPLPFQQQARFHGLLAEAIAGVRPPAPPREAPATPGFQPQPGRARP